MTFIAALIVCSGLLAAKASGAPYEPNDSTLEAAGPLLGQQSLTADISTSDDRDFYFFYVTSDAGEATELTLLNAGGGPEGSDINATILSVLGTEIAAQAFIRHGETRAVKAPLDPGKYYVEVTPTQGYGDTYTLTAASIGLGPYVQITARCGEARKAVVTAKSLLRKAEGRLQRATARRRRSRYLSPTARRQARLAQARALAQVRSARRQLREARASLTPWCSIPQ